jgi:molybdopterin-containing oxidoreductase family iron-sulfur binding subunit
MSQEKKYWKSFGQLAQTDEFVVEAQNEFQDKLPIEALGGAINEVSNAKTNRRDFLKFLGFSVGAATLAACETPVVKSIPYLNKPENIVPGIANYFASSYYDGNDFAAILVKTREGRPIYVKGNRNDNFTKGGVNSRVIGSVLSLYDGERLKHPTKAGVEINWDTAVSEIKAKLTELASSNKKVALLTNSIISPSTNKLVAEFIAKYPNVTHITYDAISYSGIRRANELTFGKAFIPTYNFDKAKAIVSIGADFLSSWLMPTKFMAEYAKTRQPESGSMSKHIQFESNLSLSGANADARIACKPSEFAGIVVAIYNKLASQNGKPTVSGATYANTAIIDETVKTLNAAKGASIVILQSNNPSLQALVNGINYMLGNYGTTIDENNSINLFNGSDIQYISAINELKSGVYSGLICIDVNPAYSDSNFTAAIEKIKSLELSVAFTLSLDETASLCQYALPVNHYLESWNDLQISTNQYNLVQPTISNLFNTKQYQDVLLSLTDSPNINYYNYIKSVWKSVVFTLQSQETYFESFWNLSLHNGSFNTNITKDLAVFNLNTSEISKSIASNKTGDFEVCLYQKAGLGIGNQANNPWLQELPDPITKITWDNYVTMSPKQMEEMGFSLLERGDHEANVVKVNVNNVEIELPVVPQPGQAYGTIGIALGYGRTNSGKVGNGVGKNVFPFISKTESGFELYNIGTVSKVEGIVYPIAATQTHHTMMGRSIVKETTLNKYKSDQASGNEKITYNTLDGVKTSKELDLWAAHPVENVGHRWGLAIDLNTCIGCGACVTACQSENNVPVVGKDEVRRSREMHWIRIDRYYSSDIDESNFDEMGKLSALTAMERAAENPLVNFQPVMCQHCNHAPCETVCPVAATTHSNEGLNQMTYNRCIGTRYCANNCPYKVRRFNWFNYVGNPDFAKVNPSMDDLGRMVLNPDVTVRSRGVMEKCSLCVQNIQTGKLKAKVEGRKVVDGDIETACQNACPTNAIVFGDINDSESRINQLSKNPRAYHLLEEVGVQPNIYYMVKVRNSEEIIA